MAIESTDGLKTMLDTQRPRGSGEKIRDGPRMEEAWGKEEHLAKLSVNSLIGLWARNVDLLYLMRTSNNQLDGNGCQYRQTFVDSKGGTHWDHVHVAQLFSNASHCLACNFVMAAEYCAVARIRQQLAEVPKTDCLGLQLTGLPGTGKTHLTPRTRC